jgi:shikimate kinase
MSPHVILAGFMGTGKTSVGRRVAQTLGRTFVDTDALVESSAGRSVTEVFATDGEARFRAMERDAIARACAMPDAVIAIGGGALTDAESRRRLMVAGPVICLRAAPEDILSRVGDASSRPLLAGIHGESEDAARARRLARIRALLDERAATYALATHQLDTSGLSVDEVAERVCTLVTAALVEID